MTMKVFIRDLKEELLQFQIDEGAKIYNIKEQIENIYNIAIDLQILIINGKALQNNKTFKDYNIHPYSTIEFNQKLLGGLFTYEINVTCEDCNDGDPWDYTYTSILPEFSIAPSLGGKTTCAKIRAVSGNTGVAGAWSDTVCARAPLTTFCASGCSSMPGDANDDGEVNIADIVTLVNIILGAEGATAGACAQRVDGDIDISDIMSIITTIFNMGADELGLFSCAGAPVPENWPPERTECTSDPPLLGYWEKHACIDVGGDPDTIGNGHCDDKNNNEFCLYDGGDCCPTACADAVDNNCPDNSAGCHATAGAGCGDCAKCKDPNSPDNAEGGTCQNFVNCDRTPCGESLEYWGDEDCDFIEYFELQERACDTCRAEGMCGVDMYDWL